MQKQIIKIFFIVTAFFVVGIFQARAATYYVCGNAAACNTGGRSGWGTGDDSNNTTQAQNKSTPWQTITAGIDKMSNSDTLIVGNGTYVNDPLKNIKSGADGAYTIIKAENIGGATVDMSGAGAWLDSGLGFYNNSYVQVENFLIRGNIYQPNNSSNGPVIIGGASDHIKLFRIGAFDANSFGNTCVFCIGDSGRAVHDILVEDSWAWGTGRYKFNIYRSANVILRRNVIRHDAHIGYEGWTHQEACIANYDSSNTQLQNNIMIDSGVPTASESMYGAIWDEKHTGEGGFDLTKSAKYSGNIILNIKNTIAAHLDRASGTRPFQNNVIWDINSGGYVVYADEDTVHRPDVSISNNTIGNLDLPSGIYSNLNDAYTSGGFGVRNSGTGTFSVSNSIIYNAAVAAISANFTSSNTALYANAANYSGGASAGTGNTTNINPLMNGLLYLPRIEETDDETCGGACDLKTAGSGGGQVGAQIIKQYGKSGTLYGETGYDLLQDGTNGQEDIDLWPFPNEEIIKSTMGAWVSDPLTAAVNALWDSGTVYLDDDPQYVQNPLTKEQQRDADLAKIPGVTGARGFATGTSIDGSPQTLTKYIWEYLKTSPADLTHEIPCEIYGTCSGDVIAPSAPSELSVM